MITVSIVTYHTPDDELSGCLRCLESDLVKRVYVVDNSRSRSTRDIVEGVGKGVYIPSDNVGYGAGHNQALRRVIDGGEADYHLVMNSDIEFDSDILGKIAEYMDGRRDVGALQPLVYSPGGERQYTCRALPRPADVFARRFLPRGWFAESRDAYLLKHLDPSLTWNVPYHQGSFMFLRVSALRVAGLFDERFFMYPEDIDLTRRIHRHFLTVMWPGASIVHAHRAESYKSLRMTRIHAWNMVKYFNKWGWLRDDERDEFNRGIRPV